LNRRRIIQLTVIASGTLALVAASEAAAKREKVPLPRARPVINFPAAAYFGTRPAPTLPPALAATEVSTSALAYTRPELPLAAAAGNSTPSSDIEIVKRAGQLVRRDRFSEASVLKSSISDPLARKLVEWMILRGDQNHTPGFERYAAFVADNPSWPSVGLLRKRAEAALWDNRRDPTTILNYFAKNKPLSAKGHLALARALLARGDKHNAQRHVREAWRSELFHPALEQMVLEVFPGMLHAADHRARMHRRLHSADNGGGLRLAQKLGGADLLIAKAWIAVNGQAKNAKALLDAVPANARSDPGYIFSRARWLRRADKIAEAAQTLLTAPRSAAEIVVDPDNWWLERRVVVRDLIEAGQYQTAYRIARDAAAPEKGNYRVDREFTAGWVALRFLKDPVAASRHFAVIATTTRNPTALARAGYWLGRSTEAVGKPVEAREHYAAAARFRTTYYGQLAHARLGETEIALPSTPRPSRERRAAIARLELVRALNLLYVSGESDLAIPFVADVGSRIGDAEALAALGEITHRNGDARATMLLGRAALNQGLALAEYAFPKIGVPNYKAIGPEVHPSLLFSIVRQESAFNQATVSHAKAMGLMQVTPPAGRYIARKFKVTYDQKRLLSDKVYNVQMGAAELGDLLADYRGSYILTFVGYNAGRGRVRDWIKRFGDPRDPNVDPVDWVEKIPFSETRNYVQRILENLQVYRTRFGATHKLLIEADLRGGATSKN
jgi:soluble lytic murein transglycosylase